MTYQYEREAARGDPAPDGLSLTEQTAYQAVRSLYAAYRARQITQGDAAKEKAKILQSLNREREMEELRGKQQKRTAEMWKAMEDAASRYGTDRTLENADRLIEVIYGVKLK